MRERGAASATLLEIVMRILPAGEFPGAEQAPLEYPGRRPSYSYVYYRGRVYPLSPKDDELSELWVEDEAGPVRLDDFLYRRGSPPLSGRSAVLAVGSNGCPGRLAEKYKERPETALPVFVGAMSDTAVVYSRVVIGYGALAATYLAQPGAKSWLSVTMLTDEELARMDETEAHYERIPLPGFFQMDGGPRIGSLTAYLDPRILTYKGAPILLKMFARGGVEWPAMDERHVLSLVLDEAGLFRGEAIEERHRRLRGGKEIREALQEFLERRMGALSADERGRLIQEPGEGR